MKFRRPARSPRTQLAQLLLQHSNFHPDDAEFGVRQPVLFQIRPEKKFKFWNPTFPFVIIESLRGT